MFHDYFQNRLTLFGYFITLFPQQLRQIILAVLYQKNKSSLNKLLNKLYHEFFKIVRFLLGGAKGSRAPAV